MRGLELHEDILRVLYLLAQTGIILGQLQEPCIIDSSLPGSAFPQVEFTHVEDYIRILGLEDFKHGKVFQGFIPILGLRGNIYQFADELEILREIADDLFQKLCRKRDFTRAVRAVRILSTFVLDKLWFNSFCMCWI